MYKASPRSVMDRHVALYRRQMADQILVNFITARKPGTIGDYIPIADQNPDQEWTDRECRSEIDMEGIIGETRRECLGLAELPDDGLPTGYPTAHFGESLFSGMLGGKIRFVGTRGHTCSGAEPLLNEWEDLPRLRYGHEMPWTQRYLRALRRAAELAGGDFFFWHFVMIDTLNLAIELRGSENALLDTMLHPDELRELMQFGVDYACWFYKMEQEIIERHNLAVAHGHPYAIEAPYVGRAWSSVDAYLLCDARVYREMGLSYHAELFRRCGGGLMHTHGVRLLEMLPMIVEIPDLTAVQVGRDLKEDVELPLLEILPRLRKIAGDIPLIRCTLWEDEFEQGLREHLLVGGAHYMVRCAAIEPDRVKRWMEQVHRYRWSD